MVCLEDLATLEPRESEVTLEREVSLVMPLREPLVLLVLLDLWEREEGMEHLAGLVFLVSRETRVSLVDSVQPALLA